MCGIAGMVLTKRDRTEDELKALKFFYGEMLCFSQKRGKDATGIVAFNRDGEHLLRKTNVPALDYTLQSEWQDIANFITNDTGIVLGHVRLGTQGVATDNNNNHPIEVGNVIGVHNGGVQNDFALFNQFKFDRIGKVDSEIIFQLLNHYNPDTTTYEGLKRALVDSNIRGMFAIGFVNKNEPNLVHIIKQERPMTITWWEELGAIIFNSEEEYVTKGFESLKRFSNALGLNIQVTKASIEIKKDLFFTINSEADSLDSAISLPQTLKLEASWNYSNYYNTRGTSSASTSASTSTATSNNASSNDRIRERLTANTVKADIIEEQGLPCDTCNQDDITNCSQCMALENQNNQRIDDNIRNHCCECGVALDPHEKQFDYNIQNPTKPLCEDCGRPIHFRGLIS